MSFPFLRIARAYGVDYGEVLALAHYWQHAVGYTVKNAYTGAAWEVEVARACDEQWRARG